MENFWRSLMVSRRQSKSEAEKRTIAVVSHKEKHRVELKTRTENQNDPADVLCQIEDYLQASYYFRFNVLTEVTEFRKRAGNESFVPITQRELNTLCIEARKEGINCWDRDISRFIYSDSITSYHPFQQYMEKLPTWDGMDRVKELAHRVSDLPLWIYGFHIWLRGMTMQWMGMQSLYANSVAPVLISLQQGKQKSTFCRLLLPEALQGYYTDSFNLTAQSGTEQKLTTFGLINLDEMDKFSDKQMTSLKNLMQMSNLNIRKAHKKNYSSLPRIASFIATSNRKDLLNDPSGSRRFLCIEIQKKIDCSPIDHPQLYAQLKTELLAGERYWFTSEEEQDIHRHNAAFRRQLMAEDIFYQYYRKPKANEEPELLAAGTLFTTLKKNAPAIMREVKPAQFSRMLTSLGVERVHTRNGNLYKVKKMK